MGIALAFALVLITGISTALFMSHYWWFPVLAAQHGAAIDNQFMLTFVITGIIFVAAQVALGYMVFRYGKRGQKVQYLHGNNRMEVIWTTATAILFIGLNLMGQKVWAERMFQGAAAGAIPIEIVGQQFAWNMRYAGADGKFGRTDVQYVDDSTGNPLGIDPKDPAGKDDIVAPTMAVPVNREIELILKSKDVTHSFFVRELRLKQDAVPGMAIHVHFTPTRVGQYEIACAELCGLGHYKMRSFIDVLSDADYQKWLADHKQ